MLTETLPETRSPDAGGAIRLNYRCRTCGRFFRLDGYTEVERDFYQGGLAEKVPHDCRNGKMYVGVTGIADLIGWEKAD